MESTAPILKNVIDRFYALGSQNMSIKNSYLITLAGQNDNHATEPVLNYYNYLTDFMGWNNLGTICLRAS
ncbi:MAG: hypothetical protein PUC65_17415 [Clostridiales bacterium]|nr:hypothetical protein [Clostridiales bacterium]